MRLNYTSLEHIPRTHGASAHLAFMHIISIYSHIIFVHKQKTCGLYMWPPVVDRHIMKCGVCVMFMTIFDKLDAFIHKNLSAFMVMMMTNVKTDWQCLATPALAS